MRVRLSACIAGVIFFVAMGCRPHFAPDNDTHTITLNADSLLELHIDTLNNHLPYELSKGLVFHDIMLLDDCVIFHYWCNWKDLDTPGFIEANKDTFTEMFRRIFKDMAQYPEKYGPITTVLTLAGESGKELRASIKTRKHGFSHSFKVFTVEELNELTSDYLLIKDNK